MADPIQYKISDTNKSRVYAPSSGGTQIIDVWNDYPWTLSPKSARADVPYVKLKEYQQTTGQLIAAIVYYSRVANTLNNDLVAVLDQDDALEVYRYKFLAQPTGFEYKFPYFNPKKITRGNTFGSDESPFASLLQLGSQAAGFGGKGLLSLLGKSSQVAGASMGVLNKTIPGKISLEMPSSWNSTELETVEVAFDLFNTDTYDSIINNRRLCHLLSYQNTPSRRNFAIIDPPVIYSLEIPDIIQFPACYISALSITNLGNTRTMPLDGGTRTIPEAYRITMTFTALLMPTRNILGSTENGKTVEAVTDSRPFENLSSKVLEYYKIDDSTEEGKQNRAALKEKIKEEAAKIDKLMGNDSDALLRISEATGLFLPQDTAQ
jgi:hypothetical protein